MVASMDLYFHCMAWRFLRAALMGSLGAQLGIGHAAAKEGMEQKYAALRFENGE
jgi:hypothetical protein